MVSDGGEGGQDAAQWALRFISGKYQGGEFPLRPNREIIIGRSSDLDPSHSIKGRPSDERLSGRLADPGRRALCPPCRFHTSEADSGEVRSGAAKSDCPSPASDLVRAERAREP